MKKAGFKIVKAVLVMFFLFIGIFVAVYKFPDRDLDIIIRTIDETYHVNLTADEIKAGKGTYLDLEEKKVEITEVSIYASIKSIYLKNFTKDEFANLINIEETSIRTIPMVIANVNGSL